MKYDFPTQRPTIIKVIGVGGGGGNAVAHMYKQGIHDVSFLLCNTDHQALAGSEVPNRLQLGEKITEGLGAGSEPEVARQAAEESEADIRKILDDGTKMVFITAGMGGGTGTGAAPVIAGIAKDMGILTVGIVTIPFEFEGDDKLFLALRGVEKLSQNVDALLVINNERLRDIYSDLSIFNAFARADDTLSVAAKSIAEIITMRGVINLDFADVNKVLKNGGVAIMSSGEAEGEMRVTKAIQNALNSPLLNNNDVFNAQRILFNISSSLEAQPMMVEEMAEIDKFMEKFNKNIKVIWGTAADESLDKKVKFTILATGFGINDVPHMDEKMEYETQEERMADQRRRETLAREQAEKEKEKTRLRNTFMPSKEQGGKPVSRTKPYIFSTDQLDDNRFIEAVLEHPAYNRPPRVFEKLTEELNNEKRNNNSSGDFTAEIKL